MTEVSPSAPPSSTEGVRVWDPLVRLLHWLVVLCCLGAFVFERPRALHETLGLVVAGAVALRVIWGLIGPRHARFADFVTGPAALSGYLRALVRGKLSGSSLRRKHEREESVSVVHRSTSLDFGLR